MLGLIFGDMVGRPYEGRNFLACRENKGTAFKSTDFPLFQAETQFSDDTVMAVAVADCLLTGKPYMQTVQMWGLRYPNVGYGGNFFAWLHDSKPHPYQSWSNGSAMRAPPIGWARTDAALLEEAKRSAEISHDHPEGIKGAQAVAWAVYLARKGATVEEMRTDLGHRFNYDLFRLLEHVRPHYTFQTTCAESVPEALLCALEATSVEEAVRLAVSLGGDSDTLAAIAGAVAEARFGFPKEYEQEVLDRLPEDLRDVVLAFKARFIGG